jgi:hypothetical protein
LEKCIESNCGEVVDLPSGWVAVPVEPTEAMLRAGRFPLTTAGTWKAMLEAAPRMPRLGTPAPRDGGTARRGGSRRGD